MADKYCSYEELRAAEAPDAFQIAISDRNTPAVIVAPHGGKIEIGTTQIAEAIAQTDFSIYAFHGKKESDNTELHITSTRFDEAMARALVARSEYCITVHGAAGAGELVFLGGLHEELKALLRDRLTEAGFEPAESSDPDLQGTNPLNICNRGASRAGVQLEIMRGLRDALTDQTDPEAAGRLASFASAVRAAIQGTNSRRV
jgi:phage replication-related protein YjqB (UPF0714/DUF867 family)